MKYQRSARLQDKTSGQDDKPIYGELERTKRLFDAALKFWELKQRTRAQVLPELSGKRIANDFEMRRQFS